MERLFNQMVQLLARRGMFTGKLAGGPGWQQIAHPKEL